MSKQRGTVTAVILIALLATGCGSSGSETVPDVVGERLDVAEDQLDDAGFEYEEIGGGTFGVINTSAWLVCDQEPAPGSSTSAPVDLIVDRECGSSSAGTTSSSRSGNSSSSTSEDQEAVPDTLGMDLQQAQDTMQAAGFYFMDSYDVTGESSFQVIDRNWVVIEQTPAPRTKSSLNEEIIFGVRRR